MVLQDGSILSCHLPSTKVRGEFHNIKQYELGLGIGFIEEKKKFPKPGSARLEKMESPAEAIGSSRWICVPGEEATPIPIYFPFPGASVRAVLLVGRQ